jgi:hypothetical protein
MCGSSRLFWLADRLQGGTLGVPVDACLLLLAKTSAACTCCLTWMRCCAACACAVSAGASWQAAEAAAGLITSGKTPPFVIVGIDHAGVRRSLEYTPCKPGTGPGGFRWAGLCSVCVANVGV